MRRHIQLFMWGYQQHFAWNVAYLAEKVFGELGITLKPDVLLVGILKTENTQRHPVCVEPENGKWPLSLFSEISQEYPEKIKSHPLQNMFYGDEPSMRDKPENIRRSAASMVVQAALDPFDKEQDVQSFCGSARPVDEYYVVPVIQVPNSLFRKFPPLDLPDTGDEYQPKGHQSLIHSSISTLLDEASRDLVGSDPGRSMNSTMRSAKEIVAEAAERFMRIPDLLTAERRYGSGDLFQRLNIVSSLFYEKQASLGSIVLARPDNAALNYSVRFRKPIPLRESRWARKALQMASTDVSLIVSESLIHGLGTLDPGHDAVALDAFVINVIDHYQWELRVGTRTLMFSRYREPKLPQEPISRERFVSNFLRLFSTASEEDAVKLWILFVSSSKLQHGSMLMIAEDAASEAERLSDQGTPIEPVKMTPALLERVSGIDGTILLDPAGMCHAIGVILDGEATSDCSPARGSRYNSALRYVRNKNHARLAVVTSDDRTVDLIPLLRPQIDKSEIENHIVQLEKADTDGYHAAQNWLDEHRFYLNALQCSRINKALERLNTLPREVGEIRYITSAFVANEELHESYFL
jgi:hypothetical protein